jgi:sigma-B regulation protein RsbU (phosphoserine phosphatase)
LLTATFPADQGLAGFVLQSQQSEVINDVQNDPRFYGKIDKDSGFQTRNMIVIPLTAGEEKIGVLEVLNKIGGAPFTSEERLLLQSIAEEIAFAIRNGKLFEVVVKSYCKQRQGLNSCKGCKRPLGSWTPCVKYREETGLLP